MTTTRNNLTYISEHAAKRVQKVAVIVAEESYRFSLFDWNEYESGKQQEILHDARDPDESYVWVEDWVFINDDYSLYSSLHELLGRDYKIIDFPVCKNCLDKINLDFLEGVTRYQDLRGRTIEYKCSTCTDLESHK